MSSPYRRNSVFRLTPLAISCIAVFAVAGCGGSSSSGNGGPDDGNGNGTSLSSSERAALAAGVGGSAAGMAQGLAANTADLTADPQDPGPVANSMTSESPGPVTQRADDPVPIEFECGTDGAVRVAENGDTSLDIGAEEFPAPFSNAASLDEAMGAPSYTQSRSNCVDELLTSQGSLDLMVLEDIGGPGASATVYRAGGYTGPNKGDTPAIDTAFVSTSEAGSSSIRGEFHSCNGCVQGDLGDFSGLVDFDTTVVGFLDMEFDFPDERSEFTMGSSSSEKFTMVTEAVGDGNTLIDINGRFAFANEEEDCSFDVTYATVDRPTVSDFDQVGTTPTTINGRIDVTLNDTGETFEVAFDSNGNVTVDGEPVDVSEAADNCALEDEPDNGGFDDAPGDSEGPEALAGTWRSECLVLDGDQDGPNLWGDVVFGFNPESATSGAVVETVSTYNDDACTQTEDIIGPVSYDYVVPGEAADEPGAFEIDLLNRGELGGDVFDHFRIEGDTLTLAAYPNSGPDQPEFRQPFSPNSVEFERE